MKKIDSEFHFRPRLHDNIFKENAKTVCLSTRKMEQYKNRFHSVENALVSFSM